MILYFETTQEECFKKKIAGKGDNVHKLHLYSTPRKRGVKVKKENHNRHIGLQNVYRKYFQSDEIVVVL